MLTIIITIISTVYLFVGILYFASKKSGYSHSKDTISELGEITSPIQQQVAFGLFLPLGILLLIVAYLTHEQSFYTALLALCVSIGYLVATFFCCDIGSPLSGSFRQSIHNLGGGVEYFGGGYALLKLAEVYHQPFKVAGFIVLATAIALSFLSSNSFRGLAQRIAEACLFLGVTLAVLKINEII
jgi:hypothetical protein